jgi:hypothetical protein
MLASSQRLVVEAGLRDLGASIHSAGPVQSRQQLPVASSPSSQIGIPQTDGSNDGAEQLSNRLFWQAGLDSRPDITMPFAIRPNT